MINAQDRVGRRRLTQRERLAVVLAKRQHDKKGLSADVVLAERMKVMVTLNLQTDMDVANGVRGTVNGVMDGGAIEIVRVTWVGRRT